MTAPAPGSHARNIAWSLAGNVVAPAMALGTAPILAQGLGVDGRGELSAATAPLLLATAVGAFGLPESVIHHTAKQFGGARRTATMGLGMISVLGIIAALLIYALAGPLSAGNDELKMLCRLSSCSSHAQCSPAPTAGGSSPSSVRSSERFAWAGSLPCG